MPPDNEGDAPPKRTTKISDAVRAELQRKWMKHISDLVIPVPLVMPPLRDIVHEINLIDPNLKHRYHPPRCPDALREELVDKVEKYTTAGWWERTNVPNAAPMLCVRKKDGRLRTVIDARLQNDNTIKDVTPFPDQDAIRHDVARGKFRTKLDMSDAYEQIRIKESDVAKTAFSTILGTFVSHVMQQGDCNAPSTFQRFMTFTFREYIGRFIHVYLDDIFIFSISMEDHEIHLGLAFNVLRKALLYLSAKKVDIYSVRMDCLGHIIDDDGIHADTDKMHKLRNWRIPRNYHDVQRFLGLVQYLAQFMPNVSAYTTPLSGMVRHNVPFVWSALHSKCFESIKILIWKSPILKPIDISDPLPIWVVCDASANGVGAFYGQGIEWYKARPAGFLSRKFTPAQCSYHTWEQELIAILEALIKWEDKLVGRLFTIVTDHKALTFFKTKTHMSDRQVRWWEFLSRYQYKLVYTKGTTNKVADALSRYYMNDKPNEIQPVDDYVNVDARIDPQCDYLTDYRKHELAAGFPKVLRANAARRSTRLAKSPRVNNKSTAKVVPTRPAIAIVPSEGDGDPLAVDSTIPKVNLRKRIEKSSNILVRITSGYAEDSMFSKITNALSQFPSYRLEEGLLYTKSRYGISVLCVPNVIFNKRRVQEILIAEAHRIVGHLGSEKTLKYLRHWYWWPTIARDTIAFCDTCGLCQSIKTSNQKPPGLLHSLPLPTRPWESVGMDFMGPLPESSGSDFIMVVICRLTSMVHVLPCRSTVTATQVADLYYREIVRLHGLPESIVSDRDPRFTSKFWQELHRITGSKLLMSTAFHPETDGASERVIRSVNQILRSFVNDHQTDWNEKLPSVEFALNSSVNSSSKFAPFELNYGWMPTMMTGIKQDTPYAGVKQFAERAIQNLDEAHDALIESRVIQTYHANKLRREEPIIKIGSKVFLSTKNLTLPPGRARKLVPKYIGPYTVTDNHPKSSNYTLELPAELLRRHIHPTFHVKLLRPYRPNDDKLFPGREAQAYYDFGADPEQEWFVDEIVGHRWYPDLQFNVQWTYGDSTWEPLMRVNELQALDAYLTLHGVTSPQDLSH